MTSEVWIGSERLWPAMVAHLWQTSIVLALVALAAVLLRRAPARVAAALWTMVVVKLWLPLQFFGGLTSSLLERMPASGLEGGFAVAVWTFYPVELVRALPVASSARLPGWLWGSLTLLWMAGMGTIWTSRVLRGRATLRRMEVRPLDASSACVELRRVARRAGVSAEDLRVTGARVLPMVRGILQPRIIVPLHLIERLDHDELRAVLLHEEEHRRRRDPLRSLLLTTSATVFFFYPPIWWLARRVREATEAACDEAAIRAGVEAEAYRDSLVRTVCLGLAPAGNPVSIRGRRSSTLRRRLRRLDEFGRIAMTTRHRLYFAAVSLALAASVFLPLSTVSVPETLAGELDVASSAPRFRALDRLAQAGAPVTLAFSDAPIEEVLEALATQVRGLGIRAGDPFRKDQRASIDVRNVPLKEALLRLGKDAGLRYEVPDAHTLIVHAVQPAGTDGVTSPVLLHKVDPIYPATMREQGRDADVVLQAVIDENGTVTDIEMLRTSDPEHPEFADSAIEAVAQWRYEPAKLSDGRPTPVFFNIFIQFRLSDGPETTAGEKDGR